MCTLMKRADAISLFVRPSAASRATRSSVSVNSADGRRPLIRLSSERVFLRPQAGSQLLEDRERLLERFPRQPLLTRLPAHGAQRKKRAAALERVRQPGELGEGALESLGGGVDIALRGGEQAAAAG